MIWRTVCYKLATVILNNRPILSDLVPYFNKSHLSAHRDLTTSKKRLNGQVLLLD